MLAALPLHHLCLDWRCHNDNRKHGQGGESCRLDVCLLFL
jgi:hypothetical protein